MSRIRRHLPFRGARRAFTIIELLIATMITAMIAGAVMGSINAVRVGLDSQDDASQEIARIARAQARLADHLYRARMILLESETVVCLWCPSEAFDGNSSNTTNYALINADELRWYVIDRTAGTISVQRVTNTSNRTAYQSTTNWATLRTTLATSNALTSTAILNGVSQASFVFTSFDMCTTRRVVLTVTLDGARGGLSFELGGILDTLQKHTDCP